MKRTMWARRRDNRFSRFIYRMLICVILLLIVAPPMVNAETDDDSDKILRQIYNARHPDGLVSFRCRAEMETSFAGDEETDSAAITLFDLPTLGMDIIYVAPFDYRVLIDQLPARADDSFAYMRLRGDDPLSLTNPGIREAMTSLYDVEYIGEEYRPGEKLHLLRFIPMHDDGPHPEFVLVVRDSDGFPESSSFFMDSGDLKASAWTFIEYVSVDGFTLPSTVTSDVVIPGVDVSIVTTTTFTDYEINPDDLAYEDEAVDDEGDEDEGFTDLYHGFENPAIEINLEDAKILELSFVLEIESSDVLDEIKRKHEDIILAVRLALTSRKSVILGNSRFETGREIIELINDLLEAGDVSDIYLITFNIRE